MRSKRRGLRFALLSRGAKRYLSPRCSKLHQLLTILSTNPSFPRKPSKFFPNLPTSSSSSIYSNPNQTLNPPGISSMTKSKSKSKSSSRKRKAGAVASSSSELAVHEDAMTILNAVVEFRSKNNGSIPTPSIMEPLFRSIKDFLHEKLTSVDQLYNKFRSLKRKYRRACQGGVGPTPSDRAFYELSVKAWREEEKVKNEKMKGKEKEKEKEKKTATPMDVDGDGLEEAKEEDGDGSNSFKYLAAQASKFWPRMGLPTQILELGLQSIDKRKAAVLEKKWIAFLQVELKNRSRSHELNREICTSLLSGLKSKPRS